MPLTDKMKTSIERHLQQLSVEIGDRPVGSEANHRAQAYVAAALAGAGCAVEEQAFDCLDWQPGPVSLVLDGEPLAARANPFAPPAEGTATTVVAASLDELARQDMAGKVAVLYGDLTAEPLFPKNFPFFTVEAHRQIMQTLEAGRPLAAILVSHEAAPITPLIEDGDFEIPSLTVGAEAGARLVECPGARAGLRIDTRIRPSHGANVIGRKPGKDGKQVVICAHYDTKHGTPGALDNAAGVAALLALAESAPAAGARGMEFIAFDGEEYYSAPGEVAYLTGHGQELPLTQLAINIDGVGLRDAGNTIAFFGCPEDLMAQATALLDGRYRLARVEPWPQGDHTMFVYQGISALAFTSRDSTNLVGTLIHSPRDTVDVVSPASIAEVCRFILELLESEQ
jgi:aminopeptidase YwaD